MSLTAIAWLIVYVGGSLMAFVHPIYGLLAYFFTYYQTPQFRWWGGALPDLRWSLMISLVWGVGCLVSQRGLPALRIKTHPQTIWLVLLIVNAFFISMTTAVWAERSWTHTFNLLTFGILYALIIFTIRTKEHFNYALYMHIFGVFTWGWTAFTDPKRIAGRLYGIGGPNSKHDNGAASIFLAILPLAASTFFPGKFLVKLACSGAAVFALNAFILCNSRGGMLGLVIEGVLAITLAKGPIRKYVFFAMTAGAILFFALLDPQFIERQFIGTEQYGKDRSATARIETWKGAINLALDYPIGAGGGGFTYLSPKYIPEIVGAHKGELRSSHSTYFQVLTDFGIQGLIFFLGFILSTYYELYGIQRNASNTEEGRKIWLHSIALTLGFSGVLIAGIFTSRFIAEVLYWLPAFSAALKNLQVIELEQAEQVVEYAPLR